MIMTKKDFHKGQEVCILHSRGSYLQLLDKSKITYESGIVTSVGRKYITVQVGKYLSIQFEVENDLREKTEYSQSYWLFPTKQDAEEMLRRESLLRELRMKSDDVWKYMSVRELELADELVLERKAPLFCATCVSESYVWTAFGESEQAAVENLKDQYDTFIVGKVDEEMNLELFRKEYRIDVFPVSCKTGNVMEL